MPAAWGGPEVDIVTQTEIVEAPSRADGSAGWCAMAGALWLGQPSPLPVL